MNNAASYTSPKIATELARAFGNSAKTVKVDIKHQEVVREFVKKIEVAHKQAEASKLVFRTQS